MKTWITAKEMLIGMALAAWIVVAVAFWFSDGICFYRGNTYSYCSVKSVPEAMEGFNKAMPRGDK